MARAVFIGLAGFAMTALPASALVGPAYSSLQQQLKQDNWYYTDPGRTQGFWDVCP
jgi:hypothetical protein